MIKILTRFFLTWFITATAVAQVSDPDKYAKLEHSTKLAAENKLAQILDKYCKGSCLLLESNVDIEEQIDGIEDIGFEGLHDTSSTTVTYYVTGLGVKIQIDDRVTIDNREKLEKIIRFNLQKHSNNVAVEFFELSVPEIGSSVSAKERALSKAVAHLKAIADGVIQKYCPDQCLLSGADASGQLISADKAQNEGISKLIHDKLSGQYLKLDDAVVKVAFSESLPESERLKIEELIGVKIKQVPGASLVRSVIPFPETYSEKRAKQEAASEDPYGLDKLRKTLSLFKEMSEPEEIFTPEQEKAVSKDLIIGGVLGLIALIITGLMVRYSSIKKESALMKQAADWERQQDLLQKDDEKQEAKETEAKKDEKKIAEERDLLFKLKSDALREELTNIFFKVPKVAKETFGKMVAEDGVEQTSKYVHLLGKTVVFELLGDPSFRRNLSDLSEYYHKTEFEFSSEDEYKLLNALKTKVTANEIRIASSSSMDAFEFLGKLDVEQIYTLIHDETSQLKSIVLSQLPSKKRQYVFELFEGESKTALMAELCKANTIPRDYLLNAARVLNKKVTSSAEFDTENLRSNDVLLDLLEKSKLREQKTLMAELESSNSDAARAIKHKLVTVHMLRYIKAGHLLEIILGLEQDDLVLFLAGAPEEVSELLLRQAPEELSDSWREELNAMRGVDENRYRMVEIKILNRIRSLAANGAVNIMDINDMIFSKNSSNDAEPVVLDAAQSRNASVA